MVKYIFVLVFKYTDLLYLYLYLYLIEVFDPIPVICYYFKLDNNSSTNIIIICYRYIDLISVQFVREHVRTCDMLEACIS